MTTDDNAYKALESLGAAPLWRFYGNLFPTQPKSRAVPYRWSWQELRPHLLHFSETLSLDEAERRVLMLVNPGLTDPPATVNTLYAGLQIILPGETAQAHRHTSNAFRFVLEGSGAWTTVDGERVFMSPGDLLLTPGWHWHDHTHEGDAPMIWLDALDYPLVNALEAGFYEKYPQRLQPVTRPDDAGSRQFLHGRLNPVWLTQDGPNSPVTRYTWEETRLALEGISDTAAGSAVDGIVLEYTNPWTGGPVMPTIGCRVQRLRPGFRGAGYRHTASTIFTVVRGEGTTIVDGERLEWSENDTFAVPGWTPYRHLNHSASDDAVLFSYSNEPVLRSLGLYRAEDADPGA
ncbi:cupin domain-containing protein [Streptomyces sp. NBC_00102]|uniref:cupin domain-containing protein n=1 Tax=Streptomyces sp. NBC_00102 TaxID=2975652 RepID=UPI0022593B68|nr:cupin domain-containing protein [Streptomyces sp. NBC_00102]MCX5402160.1 cupin domain-containing protein [Streptomyces sp. NBC_00102]